METFIYRCTQWSEDNVTLGLGGEVIIGGNSDGFLVKYNSDGDGLWTRIFGSENGREEVTEIKSDLNNVYITGYTQGVSKKDIMQLVVIYF